MSYDFDDCINRDPPIVIDYVPDPKDLEVIVMLLQLGAICLTANQGDCFSFEQLYNEVKVLCDNKDFPDEKDCKIVIATSSFLKKEKGGLYSLK